MPKFSRTKYDPRSESTKGHAEDGKLVLVTVDKDGNTLCPCGCEGAPTGKKSVFVMGHDARFRGQLIRAACTETTVVLVDLRSTRSSAECTALEVAAMHGSTFEGPVKEAKAREDAKLAARKDVSNKAIVAHALKVGDQRTIKVGRWKYTGEVVGIFDDGDEIEIQYTDGKGNVKTARKPKAEVKK